MTAVAPLPAESDVPESGGWERTLSVAGRRIRVAVRPATTAPGPAGDTPVRPLVLVNGIGASLELFEPQIGRAHV